MNYVRIPETYLWLSALLCLVLFTTAPSEVLAQNCAGDACVSCGSGTGHYVGQGSGEDFSTNFCKRGSCPYCEPDETLPTNEAAESEALVITLTESSVESLPAITKEFGDRILLNRSRGMVVVVGGCGEALQAAAFLPSEHLKMLESLGLVDLDDFLAQRAVE